MTRRSSRRSVAFRLPHSARRQSSVPRRIPEATKGFCVSNGIVFLVTVTLYRFQCLSAASRLFHGRHETSPSNRCLSGAARNKPEPGVGQRFGQPGIVDDLLLICLEIILNASRRNRLRRDDVNQRPALHYGKNAAVNVFCRRFAAKDQTPRGPQRVLWLSRDEFAMRHRRRMQPGRDQTRDMGNVASPSLRHLGRSGRSVQNLSSEDRRTLRRSSLADVPSQPLQLVVNRSAPSRGSRRSLPPCN